MKFINYIWKEMFEETGPSAMRIGRYFYKRNWRIYKYTIDRLIMIAKVVNTTGEEAVDWKMSQCGE